MKRALYKACYGAVSQAVGNARTAKRHIFCTASRSARIRSLKQFITGSRHSDLFAFQLLNWSGSILLFSAFARFESAEVFARIGKAEVMLGCIGVFLLSASLQCHKEGLSKQGERSMVRIRMCIALLGWAGALAGAWHAVYALAAMSVAAVPAHIPLLLGYRPVVYGLLLFKLLIAGSCIARSGFGLDASALAAVYFAPTILYGIGCYAYYWRLLPERNSFEAAAPEMGLRGLIFQFVAIAACTVAQSSLVFQVIRLGWEFAVLERLLRSAYSFCFPYMVRYRVWTTKVKLAVAAFVLSFFATIVFRGIGHTPAVLMLGPLMLDIFSSAIAGRFLLADAALLALLAMSGLIAP